MWRLSGGIPSICQEQIFADGPGQIIATASVSKDVEILTVDGGFRVSGTWRFSSGIHYAGWVIVSTKAPRESLDPVLMFTLRVGEVRVDDVWHVAGMCGTGSKDLRLDDVFVADAWVTSQSECFGPAPVGVRHNPHGYLFGVEFISYLDSLHIGPVLGCAEGAFDECVAATRNRAGTKEGAAAKTHPILLERVAESAAQLSCARHLY